MIAGRKLFVTVLVLMAACASRGPARAADDTAAFVDALRARGLHDLALDYLGSAADNRLVTDEFKQRIPYERGVTLLAKWRVTPSATERKRIAAEIRSELQKFAAAQPDSPLAADAQGQLATLLTETATRELALLKHKPLSASEQAAVREEARQQLQDARDLLADVEKSIESILAGFAKALDPKTESDKIEQRRQLRARLSQVRVLRALTLHQEADTFDQGDPEFTQLNEQAANELQELYEKYANFLVGFHARVFQGECYLAIGKYKEAAGCFEDIILQGGESPAVRNLVTKAHALQAASYLAQEQYDTVLAKQAKWLEKARRAEENDPEWLGLKFRVAEAQRRKAALAETKESEKRRLLVAAKELYAAVAGRPGEFQDQAKHILTDQFAGEAQPERPEPKTFDEALQAAKTAIHTMNAAKQALAAAEENNPDGVPALQGQIETGYADALDYLEAAQRLVDDDTPIARLNETRWLTSWLLWQDEQFHRAAVLADFLAQRYPEDPNARGAAQVALSSYDRLYQQAVEAGGADAGQAEARRLKDLASFIARRWEASELANIAFGVLMNFSIRDKEFDNALALVEQLEESRRAEFQAKVANAMWETQLRAAAEDASAVDRDALRAKAVELFEGSFPQLQNNPKAVDTLAAASLYLVQARIGHGQYDAAIELLEHPQSGPLALTTTSGKVASRPAYAVEVYKSALQAYLSVVPPQSDKALATMAELEETMSKTEGGGERVARVYLGLGVQLQQQIKDLQAAGKQDEAQRVSEAFVALLDKLAERGEGDPTIRRWTAQTYYQLGESLQNDPAAAETRKAYYTKASQALQTILAEDPPPDADPRQTLVLQVQYGQTLRQAGNFEEAVEVFERILVENEMMLDVQMAAAYTLQEWGIARDAERFSEAISGTGALNDKGKPVIWGWNRLATVASSVARSRPEHRDRFIEQFLECWLNIARIRYYRAEQAGSAEKSKHLKSARNAVESIVRTYSESLSDELRNEYDRLLKNIQRMEGNARPEGLAELAQRG